MSHKTPKTRNDQRARIAQLAARLIAEDGLEDFGQAKRKAAFQLGLLDTRELPTNAEIEAEIRLHHAIFHADEQAEWLRELRHQALGAMRLFAPFNPRLTGAVLSGSAGRHARIELHLFADSDKAVEMFLLDRKLVFRGGEKRFRFGDGHRVLPAYLVAGEPADLELAVFAGDDLREAPRDPAGGGGMARASRQQLEALLAQTDDGDLAHG